MPQTNKLLIDINLLQNKIVTMALQTVEHLHLNDLNKQTLAVFILETHYPSGRIWANICSLSGYASPV